MSHFDWIHRESLRLGNMARDYHQQSVELLAEVLRLKAENERLRKAGDYMADHLAHEFGTCPSIEVWNAAKEGKQS